MEVTVANITRRVEKVCEQCQQTFSTKLSHSDQRFCAFACKSAYEAIHGRAASRVAPIEFACKQCGKPFFYKPAYLKEYRKKFNKDPMYCSRPCSDLGRRKDADERNKFTCKNCGKESYRTRRPGGGTAYYEQELCTKQCKNEWVSKVYRTRHGLPKITRRMRGRYATLNIPAQNGDPARRDVLEHRYVMEQHLGRKLRPEETVHHKNGDKTFNELGNLELFSSRHGPGQRIVDKVTFAAEILRLYPEFAREIGVRLCDCEHCPVVPTPP